MEEEYLLLCEAKADKYGRDFRVINRWEPTSQVCAAKNIEKVGMGYRHDYKRTMSDCQTTSVASCCETSRITVPLGR